MSTVFYKLGGKQDFINLSIIFFKFKQNLFITLEAFFCASTFS